MPLPVSQSKVNAIRQGLLCKDHDRESEAMAQLYDIPPATGYDNVWRLIDEVYSEHLLQGSLRGEMKEIRAEWRKAGFKSDRPKKTSHRRRTSKGSNTTTTSSSATRGTTSKRKLHKGERECQPQDLLEDEVRPKLSPSTSALEWCDACGWAPEGSSSPLLQCGACKVKVHKACAGNNWGTQGLCELCSNVAKTEGASLEDMRQFGGELVTERSLCQICGRNYVDCATDSGEDMRIGLYMVSAASKGEWAHGICCKYAESSLVEDVEHTLLSVFRSRPAPHEPGSGCDHQPASGSPLASSTGDSTESLHEINQRYKRNKIQLVDSPIASKRRRRGSEIEIPKPAEASQPSLFEVADIHDEEVSSGSKSSPIRTPEVANQPSTGPSHTTGSERQKIAGKLSDALMDATDSKGEKWRLVAEAAVIEGKLHEREFSSRAGYLSLVRQFKKFLAKKDSVPRMKLRRGEVDGAYVGGLEPWELQDEASIEERRRLEKKNMRMVTLGDIPREVDDDDEDQPPANHDCVDTQEGLSVGPNGLPVMPPSPNPCTGKDDSTDLIDLVESDFDGESSDSEGTKNRQRLWWET